MQRTIKLIFRKTFYRDNNESIQLVVDLSKYEEQYKSMKTLSVKQPYATLICAGVKDIENRDWTTDYRGRLLIHASGDFNAYPSLDYLPKKIQNELMRIIDEQDLEKETEQMQNYEILLKKTYEYYGKSWKIQEPPQDWIKDAVKKYGWFMSAQAIIGEVTLVDVYDNMYDAESDFANKEYKYFWKLTDPVLYDKPIKNVIGHLRIWNFDK